MSSDQVKRKAALWVAVIFVLGVSLGGVVGYLLSERASGSTKPVVLTDDQRRSQRVAQLTRDLNLTPDQAKQMDATIAEVQAAMHQIRQSTQPQIDAARQKGREKIRGFLTADQKPKFEEFLIKLDEERKKNGQQ